MCLEGKGQIQRYEERKGKSEKALSFGLELWISPDSPRSESVCLLLSSLATREYNRAVLTARQGQMAMQGVVVGRRKMKREGDA